MTKRKIKNALLILSICVCLPIGVSAAEMCECPCDEMSYDFSKKVIINEIFPAPESGGVEFIELKNTGSKKVDLNGWKLSDASDKMFTISKDDYNSTEMDDYFVVTGDVSKIFLNNGGDTVELYQPDENLLQSVDYEGGGTGQAYAFNGEDWAWTPTPTSGLDNKITGDDTGEEEDGENGDGDGNGDNVSITEARDMEKGTDVKVSGVVTVEPGILGTQIFYIQDEEAGIQIYCSKKEFPSGLKVGDVVEVNGEVSESRNEKKINYSTLEDIAVVGSGEAKAVPVEQLGEEVEGRLVMAEGPLLEKDGTKFYLENNIIIYFKTGIDIDKGDFEEGDVLAVTGIVSQYDEEYRMMPRGKEDIEMQSSAAASKAGGLIKAAQAAGPGGAQNLIDRIPQPGKYFYYIAGAVLALLIGLIIAGWKMGWHKKIKLVFTTVKKTLQEA
ncbi:MAG: lamin tail domain-containing protein [Patescibacteria group bacterium]|nr:lamin tail domain-containing protein [Patescibacteria group bacterium]